MKLQTKRCLYFILLFLFTGFITMAQNSSTATAVPPPDDPQMKTWLIERDIPGAAKLDATQLKGISQKSCSVLAEMGPQIKWIHSYVTGDKIFCIYQAKNEALLKEHAQKGGFPINKVTEISGTISPATAK